ncbi:MULTISPECIES: undecaprenyl-diphosphate phosphatase [Halomonas]|uniref:Undecaprenyl-diphosphatase n=1 Tax=Halomonas halophila TaxID=29573 RepID=A0ABQ0U4Z4_9GAMM|nr:MULTISPECIES: undecaprenyl-diphosphate phosphatase [Halomonas]MDR5889166.1 undecaprenyl-diphosphate phosphatase [Halomonas salina]RAH37179.1 undecaprenyl-diphosphate phosphatase [Halomonas sp. SL1]WJY07276.1 undecaprenyl-diphosphate phosphatase [Halomonas halophila]GEK73435.1 undecaprenyl-diphosphatase 1 [Halomonas halophila]
MEWLQIVVLSLVQGLSEFLPVSSSAHLILVPVFSDWPDQGLAFDVALHLGSLAAVVLYFRHELVTMTASWGRSVAGRGTDDDARLAWWVILATIPVAVVGLAFEDVISEVMRSPLVLAGGLIVFGVVLGIADWRHRGTRSEYRMSVRDALWIGLAQALALIPGTSRSGITMTAALMLGLSREAAARFSFLLSIPVIVLAGGLEALGLAQDEVPVAWGDLAAGTVLSGISAYLCIHFFLVFIRRIGMQPFVVYRLILGVALIWLFG